jgi:23S rRNA-intervening sequence protein
MALYYDLPVYRDVYSLILKIFEYTRDFPREYKYTLGQDLKRDSLVLVRSIYRANKAKSKTEYLELFLDDFEILKLEVRLCVDLKILPMKKQAEIAGLMEGIGKQITGWRNAGMVRGA